MTWLTLLAANLPMIICFLVGVVLLVLEAFMPGFGLPGISGVVLEVAAVTLCWMNIGPAAALGMTVIILALLALAISMSLRSVAKGRLSKSKMVLNATESNEDGYRASEDMQSFLGLTGTASTVLRPTGMAEFDGVKLNVVSDGEFITAGARVKVTKVEGGRILVREV